MKPDHILALAAFIAATASTIVHAQNKSAAQAFGAMESVESPDLSPDGAWMSYLAPRAGGGNSLFVVPVNGGTTPKLLLSSTGDPEVLQSCSWIAKTRLICNVGALARASGYVIGASRMIAVDADGSNLKVVSKRADTNAIYSNSFGGRLVDMLPNEDGAVLMLQWNVPKDAAGSLVRKDREGYSLDRVDTRTLHTRSLTPASVESGEYITDGLGNVRIMGVSRFTGDFVQTGVIKYKYKKKEGGNWLDLSQWDMTTNTGFNPYAIDPVEDVAYGFQKKDGRFALYKRTLGDQRT